jgi:hypothetical protein
LKPDDQSTPIEILQPSTVSQTPRAPSPVLTIPEQPVPVQNDQGTVHFDPQNNVPNPFISAVSPLALHLPQSIKDKITNNQFCNFGALLFHDPTSSHQNHVVFEDGAFQVKPKQKEQKISNLSQWIDAFAIFASVYLVKHPSQAIPFFREEGGRKK